MAVVNVGLNQVAQFLIDDISHHAIGTGTTAVVATDTTLDTETDRNATTKETRTGAQVEIRSLFQNSELPTTIEEVGLFDAGASGNMHTRRLFTYAKQASRDLLLVQLITVQEGS